MDIDSFKTDAVKEMSVFWKLQNDPAGNHECIYCIGIRHSEIVTVEREIHNYQSTNMQYELIWKITLES